MKSWNEIRKAATAFSKRWKDAYDDKSQAQSSLKEFFAVFGVDSVTFGYNDRSEVTSATICGIANGYGYDAFGNTIAKSGPLADFFRHRFSTKYFDIETGLYYYGYRFYHPTLMRWLNRDPIGEDGGLNLYGFCGNNLTYAVDSYGLRIYITIERKLNEDSVPSTENGTGRGVTEIRLTGASIGCSRCRLRIKGRYTKIMYVLSPENEKWNRRLERYNRKWGNPRSNSREREATIAHENDHWKSWSKVESYIHELNSLDGKFMFFCDLRASSLATELNRLIREATRESGRYDTEPGMNQGGMNQ